MLYLLPGVLVGVVIGVQLIGKFSPRELNIAIGLLAISFVIFQFVKAAIFRAEGAFAPNHRMDSLWPRRGGDLDICAWSRAGGELVPHPAADAEGDLRGHHGADLFVDQLD